MGTGVSFIADLPLILLKLIMYCSIFFLIVNRTTGFFAISFRSSAFILIGSAHRGQSVKQPNWIPR